MMLNISRKIRLGKTKNFLMELVDRNNGIKVNIAPFSGGELSSFKVNYKNKWYETICRANKFSEPRTGWRGRAPLLFPSVGRNYERQQLKKMINL